MLPLLTGPLFIMQKVDFSKVPFEAIIVIHDPLDWALDIQIATDIVRSKTKICRDSYKRNETLQGWRNITWTAYPLI